MKSVWAVFKYAWIVFKNLIVLGIAVAIFGKADSDYQVIVFSLLVMIYLSVASFRLGLGILSSTAFFSFGKELLDIKKLIKESGISNTTLNPVFSEEEIGRMKKENERVQREADRLFKRLREEEKEEIKSHHEAGKDKSSFVPSATLLDIIKEFSVAITQRNVAIEDYEKMIKANLAVHNGAVIDEARDGCKLRYPLSFVFDKEIEESQEKQIKERKEYWESSWEYILNRKEEHYFKEYEDTKEEDEKQIVEAKKNLDKDWIKYYIEGCFISIIFFIASWNLLKGLHIF